MGFSTNRCLPASAAAIACEACKWLGLQMSTISTRSCRSRWSKSSPTGQASPNSAANRAAVSVFRPTTETISTWGFFSQLAAWALATAPGPTIATPSFPSFTVLPILLAPGGGLVHFSAERPFWPIDHWPKTWACPFPAAQGGQSHFRGGQAVFRGDAPRAAKIGTVPCERLHPFVTALFAGRRSAFFPPCSRQLTSNCHGWPRGRQFFPGNARFSRALAPLSGSNGRPHAKARSAKGICERDDCEPVAAVAIIHFYSVFFASLRLCVRFCPITMRKSPKTAQNKAFFRF